MHVQLTPEQQRGQGCWLPIQLKTCIKLLTPPQFKLSLSVCGGSVPGPLADTKIRRCPSPLYKMAQINAQSALCTCGPRPRPRTAQVPADKHPRGKWACAVQARDIQVSAVHVRIRVCVLMRMFVHVYCIYPLAFSTKKAKNKATSGATSTLSTQILVSKNDPYQRYKLLDGHQQKLLSCNCPHTDYLRCGLSTYLKRFLASLKQVF